MRQKFISQPGVNAEYAVTRAVAVSKHGGEIK